MYPQSARNHDSLSTPASMDCIASALSHIQAIVWGERAMAALGVPLVCENYMLVIEDADFDHAVGQLRSVGFQDCAWSYGSLYPDFYKGKSKENIYRRIIEDYHNLDLNSTRFFFPPEQQNTTAKIVLLPSSYTHIRTSDDILMSEGNVHYPNATPLLRSFVQTLVREPLKGMWTSNLDMWAISYVYGELMVCEDALDSCDEDEVKTWFNESIQRSYGGIDRVTCTKRFGKVDYDGKISQRALA